MTPQAVLANDYSTSSSAATAHPAGAQVMYLGAFSARMAENVVGAPEDPIDYDGGAATLLAACDVDEPTSSSINVDSPFGI
jgi:hypothetical protein